MLHVSVWSRPFRRYLRCTCGCDEMPRLIEDIVNDPAAKFEVTQHFHFAFTCPKSGIHGIARIIDRLAEPDNPDKVRVSYIDPEDLHPVEDRFAAEKRVSWKIPSAYIASVASGRLPFVAEVEKSMLRAFLLPAPTLLLSKEAVREEAPA